MVFRELTPTFINIAPLWFRRWLMDYIPFKALKEMKAIVDTLYDKCASIYAEKRRVVEEEMGASVDSSEKANDIMSVLRESLN